jgi:hypothetical protein
LPGDLTALATDLMSHFLDPTGWASLRVAVDSVSEAADLGHLHDRIVRMHNDAATELFARALQRGEVPAGVPVQVAVETLYGAVLMHVLALSSERRADARERPAEHAAPLVAFVLAGLGMTLG